MSLKHRQYDRPVFYQELFPCGYRLAIGLASGKNTGDNNTRSMREKLIVFLKCLGVVNSDPKVRINREELALAKGFEETSINDMACTDSSLCNPDEEAGGCLERTHQVRDVCFLLVMVGGISKVGKPTIRVCGR